MSRTKVKQNLIDASFGNILEYFSYIPDGRTLATTRGNITVPNTTTYVASSDTIQDLGGAITYIPPVGTKYVEFTYSGPWAYNSANPFMHYRIQLDGTDILHSRKTAGQGGSPSSSIVVKAVIEITGSGSDDIVNGKVDTWTSGRVIRSAMRQYSSSYQGVANATRRWDGVGALTYVPAFHSVSAFK